MFHEHVTFTSFTSRPHPAPDMLARFMAMTTVASNIWQVNEAEAEFWRRSQGTRVDFSDKVLSFECGGQQWVNEVCFPVGTLKEPNYKDLDYMVSEARDIF